MPGIITLIETNKRAICRDILHALPEWFALSQAIGFLPLESFSMLWGVDYPCLVMVKPLDSRT
jgi:hypothetical protein